MKILIIGGYGNFGRRLVESLLAHYDYELIIGGRSSEKASSAQLNAKQKYGKHIEIVILDVERDDLREIFDRLSPNIVVNASGPFQFQRRPGANYRIARACIEAGCHYVDLADDRAFVTGFGDALDLPAKAEKVMLVSGASTVPGLSCAVVDEFISEFSELTSIYHGIAPGNQSEKGVATVASILSYTGKPFPVLENGREQLAYGWQQLARYDFGAPLGKRWLANCNIPDLSLLPVRYPSLQSVRFQASLELPLLHMSIWFLSGLVRLGLIRNLASYAYLLSRLSDKFLAWGSGNGGMFVQLRGKDKRGNPKRLDWQLVAEEGTGPNVPTIAAELIINRIAKDDMVHGAMPCMGLFTLPEFFAIANRWGIVQRSMLT
ncbi:MAG: saccharopine dehydrogenase NADP-binding domain-containing protein [Cellvibrionaceae bacterium]